MRIWYKNLREAAERADYADVATQARAILAFIEDKPSASTCS